MATKMGEWARKAKRWAMAGCIVLGGVGSAWAGNAPPVSTMLRYHPTQEGVSITTPKPEEEAGCKVEFIKGANGGSGWAVKDANGKTLRVLFSHDGKSLDVWSYYKDGVEVYRESATEGAASTGKADQFRWLNADGMKWGVDEAKAGHITHWKAISPEEVSQEILSALASKDFARLQALMITEAEMKQIGLSEEEAARIRTLEKGACQQVPEDRRRPAETQRQADVGSSGNRRSGMHPGRGGQHVAFHTSSSNPLTFLPKAFCTAGSGFCHDLCRDLYIGKEERFVVHHVLLLRRGRLRVSPEGAGAVKVQA